MTTKNDAQLTALQNFADSFNLVVKNHYNNDKRKKINTFILCKKDGVSVSKPLTYDNLNLFMLGMYNYKKYLL